MNSKLKSIIQYTAMLLLTASLLWLSLRGLTVAEGENKADFILNAWRNSNKFYLLLMFIAVMISHILRAERWRMLLTPTQNHVSLGNSFLSLMVGYLVNLAVPRGGELSRCYNLFKLEKTPVEVSFGTVVVERMIDVICLLLLIAISFLLEWNKLMGFIYSLDYSSGGSRNYFLLAGIAVAGLLLLAILFVVLRRNEKIKKMMLGFKEGALAILKVKNKPLFIFYSITIWFLYFMMSYFVLMAFKETEHLGVSAVLTMFAIGSIAMAAPLPGGAGSYHTLVPLGLVMLYNLPQPQAIAFVFIFHGWQTIVSILAGLVSLIISYFIIKWKNQR